MGVQGFDVREHVLPCQHIRQYPHATKSTHRELRLAIKEYVPKQNLRDADGAVTIIGAHANGIPKETYEPLWEEISQRLQGKIRSIWIADVSHQGASGVLNEDILGDDPHWFDHSRDLLHMVNHFRDRIRGPLVGVAHSLGCAQLVYLSIMHPSLFHSLILMEPVIQNHQPAGSNPSAMTSHRPDIFPSVGAIKKGFAKSKFYSTWDPRTFELYMKYGFRSTPTAVYPDAPKGSVTLTTTKHQESWTYLRSNFSPIATPIIEEERMMCPDVTDEYAELVFTRPEAHEAYNVLTYVQPHVLWIFGEKSYINTPEYYSGKVDRTGTLWRGSGGREAGAVKHVVLKGTHMVPLENVAGTADAIAARMKDEMERYARAKEFWATYDSQKSERGRTVVSKKWLEETKKPATVKREKIGESKL